MRTPQAIERAGTQITYGQLLASMAQVRIDAYHSSSNMSLFGAVSCTLGAYASSRSVFDLTTTNCWAALEAHPSIQAETLRVMCAADAGASRAAGRR